MPPFASAELARDSPLDELAIRHSISSVSITSLSSSPRPSSLPILDAFPLPVNSDYETAESPGGSSPASSNSSSLAVSPPPPSADARATSAGGSVSSADLQLGDRPSNAEASSKYAAPMRPYKDDLHASRVATFRGERASHARVSSTDTIKPAPDQVASSPLSRTQKRYQRYGHSYSGSQGNASPGISPEKLVPPALGPTWRSLGPGTRSAPNSAAVEFTPSLHVDSSPLLRPVGAADGAGTPQSFRHVRAPSQPGFSPSMSPGTPQHASFSPGSAPFSTRNSNSMCASAFGFANGSPATASPREMRPVIATQHLHGASQSWDVGFSARLRVPMLPSAAEHLREGSAALPIDSRLTLEHWAAAASRLGSAAGNLLLELGWAERWIPWTIISGLDLPVKVHEIDLAELKYGTVPCMGRVADALHSYGGRLQVRQQEAAALRVFELAEALGSTEAAFSAAHLCLKGGRQVKKDVIKARSLLRRVNDI